MATSQDKVHGHDYVDFDEYIDIQLKKTGSTIKMTDVLTAVVGILTLITLYLLLFVIFDHWVIKGGFGPATRGIMLAVVGTASLAWLVWKVIVPWRRRVSVLYAASTIEKASPALKSSLLNLVDISRSGHEVSPEIYQSIERRAALALTHVDVNEAVDRRSLLRLSNVLLAVVVLFCLYWIFSPKNPASSLLRAMLPSSGAGVATRTEIFNVRPGDKDVLARSQLEVTADVRGELPAQTFLYFTTADHKFVDERIDMRLENESTRKFRCVITGDNGGGILQNMTYRIVAGDASTPQYKIRVIQAPAATIDSIRLEAPAYTGREPVTQTTGAIDALEGTRVVLKATANMPVRSSAALQCFDDETASRRAEEIPIKVTDGTKLEVEWKLEIRSDGTYPHYYRIFCTNLAGESDPSPSLYSLSIRPDHPPEITLRDPKTDLDLPANAVLPLLIEARDPDFALRYIDLNIEKDGSPVNGPTIYSEGNDQQFKTTYKWSLRDYHFRPKETVTYWLQAKDNRQPIANVARTPKLRIHIIDPVPESQVKKDLQMAENRQKEAEKAEAARAAQEKPDDENALADSSQKREENEQAKQNPPPGVPNRPNLKHPKRPGLEQNAGEKGQNGEGENGAGDNGSGQEGTGQKGASEKGTGEKGQSKQGTGKTGTEQGTGKEPGKGGSAEGQTGEQESDSASTSPEKKQNLNPDDSADDSKVLQKLLDKEKRDSEQQKNPSDKGEANAGQENQKPNQAQQSEQKGASQDQKEKNESGSPSDSAQKQESQKQAAAKQSAEKQSGEKQAAAKQNAEKQASKGQSAEKKPGTDADRNAGANPADAKEQPKKQQLRPDPQGNVAGEKPGAGNKPGTEKKPGGNKPGEKGAGAGNEKGRLDATRPPQGSESAQERQKNGAAGDSTQPPDNRQKTADGRNEKPQAKAEGKAEPGDQTKEGEKNSQPRQEGSQKTPGGDSSQSGQKADAKPEAQKPAGEQGPSSDGGKENGERQKTNPGDAENGKPAGNEKGNDSNQKNEGSRNQSNAANRESAANDQTGEKQLQKNDAGVKERSTNEPGGKGEGKNDSADQPNRPKNGPSKGSAEQNTDGTQKTRREFQSKPNGTKAGAKTDEEEGKAKSDTKEEAVGEKAKGQNGQPTDRRPKKTRNEESTPLKPQPTDEQPNTIRSKKLDPRAGGGESQIGPPANATKEGTEKDAASETSSQQNATERKGAPSARKSGAQKEAASQEKGAEERPGGSKEGGQKTGEPKNRQANQGEQKSGSPAGSEGKGESKEGRGQGQKGNSGQEGQKGSGQKGEGQNGSGKNGGQKGQEGQSKDGNANGNQQGGGTGQSPTGNGGGVNNGNGPGQGAPLEDTTKEANLDYAKKATDLVLRRLDDQLKRGQVDPKVEEKLGWNQEQIRRFVERMRRQSQAAEDPSSPAAEAQRLQFMETLKSLNLGAPARSRSTKSVPKVNDAEMESKRSLPSPEYRDWYNAFTRSLNKPERPPAGDKK